MQAKQYDGLLSTLHSSEDWAKIPSEDCTLFWCFGTVAPRIAHQSHRLVLSSSLFFYEILLALDVKAGLLGHLPPSIAFRSPDHGLNSPPEKFLSVWAEKDNQESLIKEVENLKFTSQLNLICDAFLPENKLSALLDSIVYKGLFGKVNEYEWFNALDRFVNECGWFYVPLPELTKYDLFIFSKELEDLIVPLTDVKLDTSMINWEGDRAYWPKENCENCKLE